VPRFSRISKSAPRDARDRDVGRGVGSEWDTRERVSSFIRGAGERRTLARGRRTRGRWTV